MSKQSVVILGGGIGGQVAANLLGSAVGSSHSVLLIEKEASFAFSPSFLWMMTGVRSPQQITKPISDLAKKGVKVIQAEVLGIDPKASVVRTKSENYQYDYLIVALGAETAPDQIPGFPEAALNLYDLGNVSKIHESLSGFTGGKVAVLICSSPFKCPAAPYEAALLARDFLNQRNVPNQVEVYTPEPFPMPTAGQAVGDALRGLLNQKGVGFNPGHKVISIDATNRRIQFDGGKAEGFDLLIGIPPHRAPQVVLASGLAGPNGWIPVDSATLATNQDRIFAIGDVTTIPIAEGKSLPKAGVFAHSQAEVVSKNIISLLHNRKPVEKFDGRGWCAIEVGGGKAGFGSGNFYGASGPQIRLRSPSFIWHWGKVLFEKWWLWKWF